MIFLSGGYGGGKSAVDFGAKRVATVAPLLVVLVEVEQQLTLSVAVVVVVVEALEQQLVRLLWRWWKLRRWH